MNHIHISVEEAARITLSLDGSGYKEYKKLYNYEVDHGIYKIRFTRIQGDPFAPPSIIEATAELDNLPEPVQSLLKDQRNTVPVTDYLTRKLHTILAEESSHCGTGNSCLLGIPRPSPRILYRSSVTLEGKLLKTRFYIGLPALGRRIAGVKAARMLGKVIPRILDRYTDSMRREELVERHVRIYAIQEYIRGWLAENGYLSFIGEGSVIPRESSFSEKPLPQAVPFKPPGGLEGRICGDYGCFRGMLLPEGVNIIVGGAFHGKTTLLKGILEGVYDHVEGDGRELVVSRADTFMVEAEEGRIVSCVDISRMISYLPGGGSVECFSTLDASGSTSMAASISEALEAGVRHILFDEDTSATNLLYRDERMEELIPEDPITPLSRSIRVFTDLHNVSFTAIATASSAFLDLADTVVKMKEYKPYSLKTPSENMTPRFGRAESPVGQRTYKGVRGLVKVKQQGYKLILHYERNRYEIDASRNPRIVEAGQVKLIAGALMKYKQLGKPVSVASLARMFEEDYRGSAFRSFYPTIPPDLTETRGLDFVWVVNRLYSTIIEHER